MAIARAGVRFVLLWALGCVALPAWPSFVALPLAFEANLGQEDTQVRFVARGPGHAAYLTDEGARIAIRAGARDPEGSAPTRVAVVNIRLEGARAGTVLSPQRRLPGLAHYLRGADAARHVVDVPTYAAVAYDRVYPGIDLVYHGESGALEYDFVVAPHADPRRITLRFEGADAVRVAANGDLALRTAGGEVAFRRPVAYQAVDGVRRDVDARYVVRRDGRVGFRLGAYDARRTLVIDPVLVLASNLWGTATGVALDAARNIYVAGSVWTSDLPSAGGYQTQQAGTQDAYVVKLDPTGTTAVYTTYLGARRATTAGLGIAVDGGGNAYVTGTTTSTSFPLTPGAYQSTGGTFVTKLRPAGNTLAYSTLLGATVAGLAVHADGSLALTGNASTLTTTPGAFQAARLAASSPYVARLNAGGTAMTYATYLGGSANDEAHGIAVDASGNAYVVGTARSTNFPTRAPFRAALGGPSDAYVAKVNPSGTQLVYSTYLGGVAEERGFAIAVDGAGQATAVGLTTSFDFPATPGAFQRVLAVSQAGISNAFVAAFDATGGALRWGTYLGGNWCAGSGQSSCFGLFGPDEGVDVASAVAVDAAGFTYVGGYATSTAFPFTDPVQDFGTGSDVQRVPFVARIRPGGARLVYATALGRRTSTTTLDQLAVDGQGGVVAVGSTPGELFPLTAGAILGSGNAYVFKLATGAYPTTVRSSANPVRRGQPIVFSADADAVAAGGTVTFKDGATVLGTAAVVDGVASLGVTLAPGVHRITASNSADGKASPPLFQIVSGQ